MQQDSHQKVFDSALLQSEVLVAQCRNLCEALKGFAPDVAIRAHQAACIAEELWIDIDVLAEAHHAKT